MACGCVDSVFCFCRVFALGVFVLYCANSTDDADDEEEEEEEDEEAKEAAKP